MSGRRSTCSDCGTELLLSLYVPDAAHLDPSRPRKFVPLDAAAADRDEEAANYAVSLDGTRCHRITEAWPLAPHERRHHIHFATCPARQPAGAGLPEGTTA